MHPLEYLVLSVALTGLLVALVKATCKAPEDEEAAPPEPSRWKLFRVRAAHLHRRLPSPQPALVEEEAKGLKLFVSEWEHSERRVVIKDEEGNTRIKISRGMLFARKRLHVEIEKKPFLRLLPALKGKKVPVLRFADGAWKCNIQGDPCRREYEIRKDEKLVAIVSRPAAAANLSPPADYIVETLKAEEPMPLLGVVLALEVALGPSEESGERRLEEEGEEAKTPKAKR
jgi:uncharacterized protein YxjI